MGKVNNFNEIVCDRLAIVCARALYEQRVRPQQLIALMCMCCETSIF